MGGKLLLNLIKIEESRQYILTNPKVTEASHSKDFLFPNAIPYHVTKKAQAKIQSTFKIMVG